jgi:hypothetical protein
MSGRRFEMRKMLIVSSIALLATACATHDQVRISEVEGRKMATLPKGLQMEIELGDTLDSKATKIGEPVRARLMLPIVSGERVVVAEGAALSGKVTDVSGPKLRVMKAKIKFIFTDMKTRSGAVPIEASAHLDLGALATKGGKAAGSAVAKDVAKRAIPVLGTVFLIQDVANAAKFVADDKHIAIPAGTRMKIMLDKDAQFPLGR